MGFSTERRVLWRYRVLFLPEGILHAEALIAQSWEKFVWFLQEDVIQYTDNPEIEGSSNSEMYSCCGSECDNFA